MTLPPPPPLPRSYPPPIPLHGDRPAPPPPGPRARPGVHCMHGQPICRVVGTAIERPRWPVSLKIGPQIKSNQIKSNQISP